MSERDLEKLKESLDEQSTTIIDELRAVADSLENDEFNVTNDIEHIFELADDHDRTLQEYENGGEMD